MCVILSFGLCSETELLGGGVTTLVRDYYSHRIHNLLLCNQLTDIFPAVWYQGSWLSLPRIHDHHPLTCPTTPQPRVIFTPGRIPVPSVHPLYTLLFLALCYLATVPMSLSPPPEMRLPECPTAPPLPPPVSTMVVYF